MSIGSFELFKIQIPTESGPFTSAYQTCVRPLPHPPSPNCLLYSSSRITHIQEVILSNQTSRELSSNVSLRLSHTSEGIYMYNL